MLGELTETEEEQVEIRLLTDAEYQREFDMAVDDIVDRYVAGEFAGAERQRVRDYFFQSDARQEKLRFALALKEQKSPTFTKRPKTRWTAYVAIAASLIAIVSIGFIVWRALKPATDLNDGLVALQAAYREERPIEGRLSDFGYVPLPNQRGESAKVDYVQRDLAGALLIKARRDQPSSASHQAAGKYYLMLHQFAEAEKEFEAALALDPNNPKIHNDLGALFLQQCRTQIAREQNTQLESCGRGLEEIQKALQLNNSLLEALFNRAVTFQLMNSPAQATTAWKDYLAKDSSSRWAEEARKKLKQLEQEHRVSLGQEDNLQAFLQAERIRDENAARKVLSATYTSNGNEISNRSLDSLLGIETSTRSPDVDEPWQALAYVARLESNQSGDQFSRDLILYYRRSLPTLKPLLVTARRQMQSGYASFERNRFKEAIVEYKKAKSTYEQANDLTGKAFVEYRLAHCYVLLPDTEQARLAYARLLTICQTNQYRWLAAQCLFGLAHAIADASEYSQAIDYSARALAAFEQINDLNGILKSLTQLADFHQAVNRVRTALGYLSRATQLAETVPMQPTQRWGMLNQIGFSMTTLQLHAAALFYQREALQLAIEIGTPLIVSRSHSYVGAAYAALKMYPEALNEATQAFEIGRSIPGDRTATEMTAQASLQLGDIYRKAGKCEEALTHYDYSLALYRDLKFDYHAYEAHKGKLHCFIVLSNNQAIHDELSNVLKLSELYRKRITIDSQRNSFFDAEQEVYDLAIDYEWSAEKNFGKALEYSEQSRARSLLDELQRGRKQTAFKSPVSPPLTVEQIQQQMPRGSQIVQYAVLDDKLIIWVVTPAKIQCEEVPVKAEELTAKVNAFLQDVNQEPVDGLDRPNHGSELYDLLIRRIERYLDRKQFLVIVADKVLNYLPFAALKSPDTSRYLIEDYDLGAAASGTLFATLSTAAERKAGTRDELLLSIGDPGFDKDAFASLRDLPSTLDESTTIAGLYPKHKLLVREQATESATAAELQNADVAHLAMHFVANEQSEMLSGFPLTPEPSRVGAVRGAAGASDGFLQSYEICRLNLRRMRLVVLSACQTGIERQYRGEGAVGAARPFLIAGVPTVVASLWPVDSDSAEKLMIQFHQNRRTGLPVTQALKQAQLYLIYGGDTRFRHPYYWAPFVAIGGLSNY